MKGIILAGGYATRLHPLTLNQSKPLLPVAGKPVIDYIIEKLENISQIDECFVVTNQKFADNFITWSKKHTFSKPLTIVNDRTTNNEDRLGTLGDIQYVIDQYSIDDDVLILGGDNLFEDPLHDLMVTFGSMGSTILIHDVYDIEVAKRFGNITLSSDHQIIDFIEKPTKPRSTLSSTLIWAIQADHLPLIQSTIEAGKSDHAGDFIADACHEVPIYGLPLQGAWFDIGNLEEYERANKYFGDTH